MFKKAENPLGPGGTELWIQIPNWPDYKISNIGRIKSFKKNVYGEYLNQRVSAVGYLKVILSGGRKDIKYHPLIHRLVAQSFLSRIPGKNLVNHKDCDKKNNIVTNLEWVNPKENSDHARRNGRYIATTGKNHWTQSQPWRKKIGVLNGRRKLSEQQVKYIKYHSTQSLRALAKIFNVSPTAIALIKKDKNWSHL